MFTMKSIKEISSRNPVLIVALLYPLFAPGTAFGLSGQDSSMSDRATLIVLAPVGPVFVDLHLTVSRIPYRQWVARFLATDMDVDQSGRLNEAELNLLTESIKSLAGVKNSTEILQAMKAATNDVAVDDFIAWLRTRIPRAFDLIAQPQPADDAVRLASLLDTDYDGAISDNELTASSRTLRFRDLDNDETFSVSELLPYRDQRLKLHPCLRDVWHDHVLFEGDTVTGLIDPSAARTETPATDLARLLGSLLGDDERRWQAAIAAYREIRPLSDIEAKLARVIDRSTALLSGMTWLERLFVQRQAYSSPVRILDRLKQIAGRMDVLALPSKYLLP